MIEPISAIALATNVVQLIEYAWKIANTTRQIHSNGMTPDSLWIIEDIRTLNNNVIESNHFSGGEKHLDNDEKALLHICAKSNEIAEALIPKLHAVSEKEKLWKSLQKAVRHVWERKDLDRLVSVLGEYRSQLNSHILVSLLQKTDHVIRTLVERTLELGKVVKEYHSLNHIHIVDRLDAQMEQLMQVIESRHQILMATMSKLLPEEERGSLPRPDQLNEEVFRAINDGDASFVKNLVRKDRALVMVTNDAGQRPLHVAAEDGQLNIVKTLLRYGAPVNAEDDEDKTALHYAVKSGHFRVVMCLMANNANPNVIDHDYQTPKDLCDSSSLIHWILVHGSDIEVRDEKGFTALTYFADRGDTQAVRSLLEAGANARNASQPANVTPLFHAVDNNHEETASILLTHDPGAVDIQSSRRDTPLLAAARNGLLNTVDLLLDHSADINAVNGLGFSALAESCFHNQTEVGVLLVHRGASLYLSTIDGELPLHFAAQHGNRDLIKAMLDKGLDVDTKNGRDPHWTALFEACRHNHIRTVDVLLQYGASTDLRDERNGITPLIMAAMQGHCMIVESILNYSLETIDAQDYQGRTSLMWSVLNDHPETTKVLVIHQAKNEILDRNGHSPLLVASKLKSLVHVQILVEGGADVQILTFDSISPLMEASEAGSDKIIEFLLNNGARTDVRRHDGQTALTLAALKGHREVVRLLVESENACIDVPGAKRSTVLPEDSGINLTAFTTRELM